MKCGERIAQRVIVTGGFGGLGMAVGAAFQKAGAQVALVDRRSGTEVRLPPFAFGVAGLDLARPEQACIAFETASEGLGGADVLVNAAGAFHRAPLAGGCPGDWSDMHEANLVTCANMCRAAVRGLSPGGAIINIGAIEAPGMAAYACAKAGVARLTEDLAAELQGHIRVNAVLPLVLDTPANRAAMPDADPTRWTTPEAVAEVIVFLASNRARAINGALIPVTNPCRTLPSNRC
jgi:NAD(P)-dependent dehydrogenase (short-subunit alcohol dehydrogenase family)